LLHLVGYLYYWQMGFNSVFKGLNLFTILLLPMEYIKKRFISYIKTYKIFAFETLANVGYALLDSQLNVGRQDATCISAQHAHISNSHYHPSKSQTHRQHDTTGCLFVRPVYDSRRNNCAATG
jgi:hypothetical protein